MFSVHDTIVAIATPPGRGGIGLVRLSGPAALSAAGALLDCGALEPRRATFARVLDRADEAGRRAIDQVVATYFPGPRSYTGEDLVEISAHGSPVLLREIVAAAMRAGARLARPGEFTLRAFLHGRIDLVQAEAVADLVDAVTPRQASAAFDQLEGTLTGRLEAIDAALFDLAARLEASLDFPDEGYHFVEPGGAAAALNGIGDRVDALLADAGRGRLVREGSQVIVSGRTNVGKSSIFNYLAGTDRAIVTAVPGTTRDLVTEVVDVGGLAVTLIDTAGLRETIDAVESEGISRARQAQRAADATIVVLDRSRPLDASDEALLAETAGRARVIVANKCDLPPCWQGGTLAVGEPVLDLSMKTFEGAEALKQHLQSALGGGGPRRDCPALTNLRHIDLLGRASAAIRRAASAAAGGAPEELVLADLQQGRAALEEVTGRRTSDDLLRHIFERFCIGK